MPDNNAELNIDRLNDYLRLSENVLDSLPRDRVLNDTAQYQNLLYYTIFNMPRDREDFIMSRSEELLQSTQKRKSRGSDCNYEAIVMLYDYIIFLHCEKEEYEQAYAKMMRAKKMARSQHDHHLWGLYYSIQGQYYDELLNGAYVAWSKEQKEILRRMLKAANCSIRHMRKSGKETGGRFLAEYLLDKAVFLIRSHSAGSRKIKKLIDQAAFIMEKYGTENSKFGHAYYLSCAWYYTLLVPDENLATQALLQSCEISEKRNLPELDRIDFVIVPCADIALEWGMGELAAKWLESCIRCCDQYSESLPYIRKKMELYLHLLDVHCCRKDFDRCGIVIEIIDRENEENKWAGIEVTIPEEIRKAVALRESDWW